MYSISGYGSMIADRGRMDAYVKALRQVVKPDSVVVDIGTGTGIFALLACQLGAKKVYAIEPSDAIFLAKEIAAANGYADRIEFIQKRSTQVTLPELADVIISDLRGILPLFQHHIPSIIDARERLLAPGGVLIPQQDILWASVVEAPQLYHSIVSAWDENIYGFDLTAARLMVTNVWNKGWVTPAQLLTPPKSWGMLDYNTVENAALSAQLNWTVARSGTAYGLSVWFDAILAAGIEFSNAPGMPELIYSLAFFPWLEPVSVAAGDAVSVVFQANLVGEEYVWSWHSCVLEEGEPAKVKANFKQSTFFSMPLSPLQLSKTSDRYVPRLNEEGKIDKFILELMSDRKTLGDIADRVSTEFPKRFCDRQAAMTRVGKLAKWYSGWE